MKDSNKLISVLVPVVSVLLAFAIGCVVMAALGANPLVCLLYTSCWHRSRQTVC